MSNFSNPLGDQSIVLENIALLSSDDPDVRRNAAWQLGRQRDIRAIQPLIDALNDTIESVRVRVVESLGNLRDESVIPPLLGALQDADAKVRAQAIMALGRQQAYIALDPMIAALQDPDERVRAAAAETLLQIPDKKSIPALVNALLTGKGDVPHYAARSLSGIGGAATVDALLAELDKDPDEVSKVLIAEILGGLFDQRAVEPLRKLLNDPDDDVQTTAKWALAQLGAG